MTKKLLLLILAFVSALICYAQEFDVREFAKDVSDISAIKNERKTVNDEISAIVKIITPLNGLQFDSNLGFVGDVVVTAEGYEIWLLPSERRLKIMGQGYLTLDYEFPEQIQSAMVYRMIIMPKGGGVIPTDLVRITFRINEADVYVRSGNNAPVLTIGNNAVFNLAKGEHNFRFIKPGFREKEMKISVTGENIIDVNLEPGQATTNLSLKGFVIINSDPHGAEVYLNEQRVGPTPFQGSNLAGTYNLRIQYPLYHDHYTEFVLEEGATHEIPKISLKPRFGYLQLTTTPPGAEIFLDGRSIGISPIARREISSGIHEILARRSLYHEHKENFTIADGEEKRLNISLKEAFGELVLTSDPSGARVWIDGQEVGTTPYRESRQPSGTYSVVLRKDLHSDAREQIVVRDGQKNERFIPLQKNYGTLEISAPGSEIFVNNHRVASDRYILQNTPGEYLIRASRDKHEDDVQTVFVLLGQNRPVNLAPKPRLGALSVQSQPFETRGAVIFINGEKQNTTPAVFPMLIGTYQVTVRKPGYIEITQSTTIREGQETNLVINMQTFQGSYQQQARRYRNAKLMHGTGMVVALGTGGYFLYSSNNLANEYVTAKSNAGDIYNQMEQHQLYSYIALGAALPFGIMTIVKGSQQKRTERRVKLAAVPINGGALFGMKVSF